MTEGKMIEDVRTLLREKERERERKQSSNGAEESNQERTGMKKWQGGEKVKEDE